MEGLGIRRASSTAELKCLGVRPHIACEGILDADFLFELVEPVVEIIEVGMQSLECALAFVSIEARRASHSIHGFFKYLCDLLYAGCSEAVDCISPDNAGAV